MHEADSDVAEHVPLVEGINGVPRNAQRAPVINYSPDAEFGFLSENNNNSEGTEAHASPSASTEDTEKADEDASRDVQVKLDREARDDIREEEDKPADELEAAAKTSSGESVPWTPS